jgi:DNA mismatch repair protein MutL
MFATLACHSVVRAGDVLSLDEARALLEAMDRVDFRAHCPHGRPVLLRISLAEIARRFGRT